MGSINSVFWNIQSNDDEVANKLLDLLDTNKEIIEFDTALKSAHRLLNTWSRTESDTGIFLDQVKDILNLVENN